MVRRTVVRCTVPLFLAPAWELGEGVTADPAALRALGADLLARCEHAATVVEALRARGWSCRVARNELVAEKPCARAAAMVDFLDADLDPVALSLETAEQLDQAG